jgi:high-affinity iron transporter
MIAALIIVFREAIEAGLIISIVLAATRGLAGRGLWVFSGIAAGLAGAVLVAIFAGAISSTFEGSGQEYFNAGILGAAVIMLCWHNAWMASHGRQLAAEVREVGKAVATGAKPPRLLAIVIGLAVLREGSEVVLFLYGVLASGVAGHATLLGGLLGLACGAALTALGYLGLIAIPTRHLFQATTAIIALLAAGMAAQAVQFLNQAGSLLVLDGQVWDTSGLLAQDSVLGRVLHVFFGYIDRPTGLQLLAYLGTLALMAGLVGVVRTRRPAAIGTSAQAT